MTYTFELEVNEISIADENLPIELIADNLQYLINAMLDRYRTLNETEVPELWIDVSDDGDGKTNNVYSIEGCQFIHAD